jgi:GDP-L-fucose synthase
MKLLITGGSGAVGKHLQEILPDALYIGSKDYDLRNKLEVKNLFKTYKPTHVVHLAARVGGIQDNINKPAEYFDDNILMNTHILSMCKIYNIKRFIGILSTCIYPDFGDYNRQAANRGALARLYPMKENLLIAGPPAMTNLEYSYAKRCLAIQIDAYNQQYNTKYNYLIPCNLYSEYDNFKNKNKMHFITALLKKIKTSKETLNLLGTGKPLRQFMYAGDLARVIKEVLDKDITDSFNVANPTNLSINEMANIALKTLNKDLKIQYSNPELDGQYRKDVSSELMLSYIPDFKFTSFEEGIKKVYNKI